MRSETTSKREASKEMTACDGTNGSSRAGVHGADAWQYTHEHAQHDDDAAGAARGTQKADAKRRKAEGESREKGFAFMPFMRKKEARTPHTTSTSYSHAMPCQCMQEARQEANEEGIRARTLLLLPLLPLLPPAPAAAAVVVDVGFCRLFPGSLSGSLFSLSLSQPVYPDSLSIERPRAAAF